MKISTTLALIVIISQFGNVSAQSFRAPDTKTVKKLNIKSVQANCYWTDSLIYGGSYFWTYDNFGNIQTETFKLNDSTIDNKTSYTYDSLMRLSEIHTITYDKKWTDTIIEYLHYDIENLLVRKTFGHKDNIKKRKDYFYEDGLCTSELDVINDGINITRSTFNKYNSKGELISQLQVLTSFVGGTTTKEIADTDLFYKSFERKKNNVLVEIQYSVMESSAASAESITNYEYHYSDDSKLLKIIEKYPDGMRQSIIYSYQYY